MNIDELIALEKLSVNYGVDMKFFSRLNELELIEIYQVEKASYIHQDKIGEVERMIRLHVDLNINLEGIDTIFNLLQKIEQLQSELTAIKSKLEWYERD